MAESALLIIDIQNDYFPGGTMTLEGADAAGEKAATLLAAFRARKLPVFHMQHLSVRPGATFFVPGTAGVEIHPCVAPAANEKVIEKNYPNSFRETALETRLEAAGTRVVKRPKAADWGGYSGYVQDPDGFLWEIAYNPHFPHT